MDQPKDKKPLIEALEGLWSQVEANVEEAVQKSLRAVRAPTREEVARLSARLDAVQKRIEALSK